jgi:hypothetical protein
VCEAGGGFFAGVCEHEDRTLLLTTLVLRDGTLIADWDCNVLPLPRWSSPSTTNTFRFRAILTGDGSVEVNLARAQDKEETAGNRDGANASSNASSKSNTSDDASQNPAKTAGFGNTGNTGNRNGGSCQSDPMRFYPQGGKA